MFYSIIIIIIGLWIGKFLNRIIDRIPIILKQQWKNECHNFLNIPMSTTDSLKENLLSHYCLSCKKSNNFLKKIPLISTFLIKYECNMCSAATYWRCPVVEILTAIIFLAITSLYGFGIKTSMLLIFSSSLLVLAFIDYETYLLPDILTQSLLWLGLIGNTFNLFTDINSAVWGAIAGYLSLWGVAYLFKLIIKKNGMAAGDFKLLAALGAWMGWQPLLFIVLSASLMGTVITILAIIIEKHKREQLIPFGPYLAGAGWIALIWDTPWLRLY